MDTLPSIWREELLHPKIVHFPIALLAFGSLLFLLSLIWGRTPRGAFLLPAARITLWFGAVGAWAGVISGHMAYDIVGSGLCDPLVLNQHEDLGVLVSVVFSVGLVLDALSLWLNLGQKRIAILLAVLYIGGTGLLFYVGHLGGHLVYNQAAGVYHPSEDCHEFE